MLDSALYPTRTESDENGNPVTIVTIPFMGQPKSVEMLKVILYYEGEHPYRIEFEDDYPDDDWPGWEDDEVYFNWHRKDEDPPSAARVQMRKMLCGARYA